MLTLRTLGMKLSALLFPIKEAPVKTYTLLELREALLEQIDAIKTHEDWNRVCINVNDFGRECICEPDGYHLFEGMFERLDEKAGKIARMEKIKTEFVYPPIPSRSHDWRAYFSDDDEYGLQGWGRTEQDAIADLKEKAE